MLNTDTHHSHESKGQIAKLPGVEGDQWEERRKKTGRGMRLVRHPFLFSFFVFAPCDVCWHVHRVHADTTDALFVIRFLVLWENGLKTTFIVIITHINTHATFAALLTHPIPLQKKKKYSVVSCNCRHIFPY